MQAPSGTEPRGKIIQALSYTDMEHDTNKTKKGCHGSPSAAGGSRYMQLSNAQEDARMAVRHYPPLYLGRVMYYFYLSTGGVTC